MGDAETTGKRLRIAHVIPTFHPAHYFGGPTETVYRLCLHVAAAGCDVRVLTTNASGPGTELDVPTEQEVDLAPGLRALYARRTFLTAGSPQLLGSLRDRVRWSDVVHLTAVYSFPTLPTLLACRLEKKPLVWSPRGALQRWEGSSRPAAKRAWRAACAWLAPPNVRLHVTSDQERHETLLDFPGWDVSVFPNGVELPRDVHPSPPGPALRLVFLGRLDPKKGIENLLSACRLLDDEGKTPWRLTVAGSGPEAYGASLASLASRLDLESKVRWAGAVHGEEKLRLFEEADVVVVPSYTENFGMVVVEALAHGVPVIASRGTPWEGLETNGCGLHVDNAPESLAHAIRRIAGMPRAEMGARGREWIRREFTWSAVAAKAVEVYEELAADAPRTRTAASPGRLSR